MKAHNICIIFVIWTYICYAENLQSTNQTTDSAIKTLIEGNTRFVLGTVTHPRSDKMRVSKTAADGQQPIATVLYCSDSRVPIELLFDCGIGDLFGVRVAGNVANVDEVGSIEYGTGHLHTPLLLVMGHTKCGAVTAVVSGDKLGGSIPALVGSIIKSVDKTKRRMPGLPREVIIPVAIIDNVWQSIEDVFAKSEEVCELVKQGKLTVLGSLYDIETGKISILGTHPSQERIMGSTLNKHESSVTTDPGKKMVMPAMRINAPDKEESAGNEPDEHSPSH